MAVVQNMAELILNKFMPEKRTISNVSEIIEVIFEQMHEIEIRNEESKKTKKMVSKGPKEKFTVECSLQSGSRLELTWFLLFRIIQKNLENINEFKK